MATKKKPVLPNKKIVKKLLAPKVETKKLQVLCRPEKVETKKLEGFKVVKNQEASDLVLMEK